MAKYVCSICGYDTTKQRAIPITVSRPAPSGKTFPKILPAPYAA